MKRLIVTLGLLVLLGGSKPPIVNSPPPTPPPSSPFPRLPSVWQSVQDPFDRSTGRIVDDQSDELNRMQQEHDERLGLRNPQSERKRIEDEQERRARIAQRDATVQADIRRARQEAQNRINNNPSLNTGLSPAARQVMADELAMSAIVSQRDRELIAANQQRLTAMKDRPQERARIEADYKNQLEMIDQQFQARRAVLMGYPASPTTQP